jgi:hypothetical protein
MCEKCTEIDLKIANYRRMVVMIADQLARDATTGLIDQMTRDKAVLHAEKNRSTRL